MRQWMVIVVTVVVAACGPTESDPELATPAESVVTDTQPQAPVSGRGALTLEEFVTRAGVSNLAETRLGEMARAKAQAPEVEAFARMMVEDHVRATEQLAAIASSKNLALPPSLPPDKKETFDRLATLAGRDFDREYMRAMVREHRDAVALFEEASRSSFDPEFRTFAETTLPTLQRHLAEAEKIAATLT